MERFDFASYMMVLRRHVNEDSCSQTKLMEELFRDVLWDCSTETDWLDSALVSRWMNGQAKLSPRIQEYYRQNKNRSKLCTGIETRLFPQMADCSMAVQEMHALLLGAPNVSRQKKEELTEGYPWPTENEQAVFLTELLCFAMEQNFVKRDIRQKQIAAGGAASPVVRDYIYSGEMPRPCKWFRGREAELARLHELLLEEGKVFLGGIPGIGKSELAKEYAKRHKNEYTNIIYIGTQGELRRRITAMDFADDADGEQEEVRFLRHERFLRTLREDTLLVVDNYDTAPAEDAYLDELLRYGCRVLITTRCRYEDQPRLDIAEMPEEDLLEVIRCFYPAMDSCRETLTAVIFLLHRYTYAVELVARLLRSGMLTARELQSRLQTERFMLRLKNLITGHKDGRQKRESYSDHIRTVFALCRLSKQQELLLRCMTLISAEGIHIRRFLSWTDREAEEELYRLTQLGLLQSGELFRVFLHPVIRDVAVEELKPSVKNCGAMLQTIQQECTCHGVEFPDRTQYLRVAQNVIDYAEKDDVSAYILFLQNVYTYNEKYKAPWELEPIFRELQRLVREPENSFAKDRALLLDQQAQRIVEQERNWRKAAETERQALAALGRITRQNALTAANLYANLGGMLRMAGEYPDAQEAMRRGLELLKDYGYDGGHDSVTMRCNYAVLLSETGHMDEGRTMLRGLLEVLELNGVTDSLDCADIHLALAGVAGNAGDTEATWEHGKKALSLYRLHLAAQPEAVMQHESEVGGILRLAQRNERMKNRIHS